MKHVAGKSPGDQKSWLLCKSCCTGYASGALSMTIAQKRSSKGWTFYIWCSHDVMDSVSLLSG